MKKFFSFLLIVCCVIFLSSCEIEETIAKTSATTTQIVATTAAPTTTTAKPVPTKPTTCTTVPKSTVKSVTPFTENHSDEYPGVGWHREIYYGITRSMINLVNYDEYKIWERALDKQLDGMDDFNEARIIFFIQHFKISREQFDRANKYTIDQAIAGPYTLEPYNADVIYTFDPIKTSNYYRQYDENGGEVEWQTLGPWKEIMKP